MNHRTPIPFSRRALWALLVLALASLVATPVLAETFDLRSPGAVAIVENVIITQFTPEGSEPAGSMTPFLSISGFYVEEGYNTAGAVELDTIASGTRAILLSQVPTVVMYGVEFREFALDLNEWDDLAGEDLTRIILDDFAVGVAPQPDLTGWTGQGVPGVTPVFALDYNEDHDLDLDAALGVGPGIPEYMFYVPQFYFQDQAQVGPECDFGAQGCGLYVYVYAYFGLSDFTRQQPLDAEVFGVGAQGPYLRPANIYIGKQTDPEYAQVVFDYVAEYPAALGFDPYPFQLTPSTVWGFEGVLPGAYVVTEQDHEGWKLVDIHVDDPSGDSLVALPAVTVVADPGESVEVMFENWKLPMAIACKTDTEGDPLAGWTINVNEGQEKIFAVQTGEDGCVSFRLPVTGTYTLDEVQQDGWSLVSPEANEIIVPALEEQVYGPYIFVNFQKATLTACKMNSDQEPLEGWIINLEGPAESDARKTGKDGCVQFTIQAPGLYTLTEELVEGWVQVAPASGSFVLDVESGRDYGEFVFVNERERAEVDVKKYVSVDNAGSWDDADEAPGPTAPAGAEVVWFKYVVTNVGNVPITGVSLDDDVFGGQIAASCAVSATLAPGESSECLIGPFEAVVGQHVNTATVTASWGEQSPRDSDQAHYNGATSGLLITKVVKWGPVEVDETLVFTICIEGPLSAGQVGLAAPTSRQCLPVNYDGGTVGWSELLPGTYQVNEENPGEVWRVEMSPANGLVVLEPKVRTEATITNTFQVSSISDRVWYDENGNGLQDRGEQGLGEVRVTLYGESDDEEPQLSAWSLLAQTVTDGNGLYLFENVLPGRYYVHYALSGDYNYSPKDMGADDTIDSDADPSTGNTDPFQLPVGADEDKWDCGVTRVVGAGVELDPPKPWSDPTCAGWKLSWDLVFTNTSPIPLEGVRLVNYHPDVQIDPLVGGSSAGAALDADGNIYWEFARIEPGERVKRVAQVRLWSSIRPGAVVTDCAKVFTAYGETELICGEATVRECATPTYTPTITPTRTATPTRTSTPTRTHTPRPTATSKPGGLYIPLLIKP